MALAAHGPPVGLAVAADGLAARVAARIATRHLATDRAAPCVLAPDGTSGSPRTTVVRGAPVVRRATVLPAALTRR